MDKKWMAKWIMDPRFSGLKPLAVHHKEAGPHKPAEHKAELQNVHIHFRKSFHLQECASVAVLDITADDYYKLYVNNRFVGQGPAQGDADHYYYNRFDVASYLQTGENVIAVHVYYHGLISRSYNSADYRQGLMAELMVDGRLHLYTDRTWKYRIAQEVQQASVFGYNTQFQERIDSRLMERGWRSAGFDDSAWQPACEHPADDHRLIEQPTRNLSVYTLSPQTVRATKWGYQIDFGNELTGQFTLRAKGKAGQKLEIRCGEERLPDDRVRYEMRCNCCYSDTWTLSGMEDEIEFFDYKAFRYVEVLADPDIQVTPESFAAVVRHYPFHEEACQFESSHALLNAVWSICKNGVKYGTQENYVDCPSREKGQYLGDNTIITHAHAYLSGELSMYRKSLEDFALTAKTCPGLMAVAPGHLMQEIADFSLQWPLQLVRYYELSGDRSFLEAKYPTAGRLIAYFDDYRRADGLLESVNDKWNLVDWPDNLRDGYDFDLTKGKTKGCHNVINAFYYGALSAQRKIKAALGLPCSDEEERIERYRRAYLQAFYDEEKKLFVDAEGSPHASLHANVLPLLFGLAPEEAVQPIVQLIREKRLSCGVYMAYFVLKALAAAGEQELLYEIIVSEDLHSWGNMVKEGATTCFEAWSKDLKWNTSLCHPWASAPVPVLIEDVFGIQPAAPGWTQVRFNPKVPSSLHEVHLRFQTPAGEMRFEARQGQARLFAPDHVTVVSP